MFPYPPEGFYWGPVECLPGSPGAQAFGTFAVRMHDVTTRDGRMLERFSNPSFEGHYLEPLPCCSIVLAKARPPPTSPAPRRAVAFEWQPYGRGATPEGVAHSICRRPSGQQPEGRVVLRCPMADS